MARTLVVTCAAAALLLTGCIGSTTTTTTVTATSTVTATAAPTPTDPTTSPPASPSAASPSPTATPGSVVIADDGTYEVPSEVTPGTYTATGGISCYWARLSGLGGETDEVIANSFGAGPAIVTILDTDAGFETQGCGEWLDGTPVITPDPQTITDGTWTVPGNVEPGRYRVTAVDGCYWARLSGFSGELSDIIVNDYVNGRATVQVSPSDAGFVTSRCGTWERIEGR